jgi:CYTH domain-containing protein
LHICGKKRRNLVTMSDAASVPENLGFGEFEFERRFLVREFPANLRDAPVLIVQNYFLAADGYAIRVRCQASELVLDDAELRDAHKLIETHRSEFGFAAVTVKGPAAGGTRYEVERELDPGIGAELVLRGDALIVKSRYSLWFGHDGWVVDIFGGDNAGLIIAECERSSPVTDLQIPDFAYTEITDDPRFSNDELALNPFANWRDEYAAELAVRGPKLREDFGTNS